MSTQPFNKAVDICLEVSSRNIEIAEKLSENEFYDSAAFHVFSAVELIIRAVFYKANLNPDKEGRHLAAFRSFNRLASDFAFLDDETEDAIRSLCSRVGSTENRNRCLYGGISWDKNAEMPKLPSSTHQDWIRKIETRIINHQNLAKKALDITSACLSS